MKEPIILPVKPGTLTVKDKAELRKAGVIVIEHDNPAELRLLRPLAELDSSDMLLCAMKALTSDKTMTSQARETFAVLVCQALAAKSDA